MVCIFRFSNTATVALNDYPSLVDIFASHTIFKTQAPPGTKKASDASLYTLKILMIDSITTYESFHDEFFGSLAPYGLQSNVLMPILALNQFGGCVVSWKDRLAHTTNQRLTVLLDRESSRENKIRLLGYSGDGRSDTDTMLGLSANALPASPAQIISESGFINYNLKVAIANEDNDIFAKDMQVGEILVHGADLPTRTSSGAKLNGEVFSAGPIHSSSGKGDAKSESKVTFIRTGLLGFVLSKVTKTELSIPRLFVVGKKDKLFMQRKEDVSIGFEARLSFMPDSKESESLKKTQLPSESIKFNRHMANQIEQSIVVRVANISAWFGFCFLNSSVLSFLFTKTTKICQSCCSKQSSQILILRMQPLKLKRLQGHAKTFVCIA